MIKYRKIRKVYYNKFMDDFLYNFIHDKNIIRVVYVEK